MVFCSFGFSLFKFFIENVDKSHTQLFTSLWTYIGLYFLIIIIFMVAVERFCGLMTNGKLYMSNGMWHFINFSLEKSTFSFILVTEGIHPALGKSTLITHLSSTLYAYTLVQESRL